MTYGIGVITKITTPSGIRYRVRVPDARGGYRSIGMNGSEEEAVRMRVAGVLSEEADHA
jgi:hypothetical protein